MKKGYQIKPGNSGRKNLRDRDLRVNEVLGKERVKGGWDIFT